MKDNFSTHSDQYAKYRPVYPKELFDFILSHVQNKETAWDCGTGNGQVAAVLADFFRTVYATDISEDQLRQASVRDNIVYKVEAAEQTDFADNLFDLITVAQAVHWFDFERFYGEAKRTLKPNGLIAVMGYGLVRCNAATNKVVDRFYTDVVGPFWDEERKYVDDNYATIPFPFSELPAPKLFNTCEWTVDEFTGYLQTWSAVQHYIRKNNKNPIDEIRNDLEESWKGEPKKTVKFPILLRVGTSP